MMKKSTGYTQLYPRKERDSIIIFALQRKVQNDAGRIRTANFGFANLCHSNGYSILIVELQ